MPLLSTAITGFPHVVLFAQTYVTKDVITRQPHQLTFKAVSLARTTDLSFYSEGLWRVVGKAASRRDRPSGSNAVM